MRRVGRGFVEQGVNQDRGRARVRQGHRAVPDEVGREEHKAAAVQMQVTAQDVVLHLQHRGPPVHTRREAGQQALGAGAEEGAGPYGLMAVQWYARRASVSVLRCSGSARRGSQALLRLRGAGSRGSTPRAGRRGAAGTPLWARGRTRSAGAPPTGTSRSTPACRGGSGSGAGSMRSPAAGLAPRFGSPPGQPYSRDAQQPHRIGRVSQALHQPCSHRSMTSRHMAVCSSDTSRTRLPA